jgi:hypothetical protein
MISHKTKMETKHKGFESVGIRPDVKTRLCAAGRYGETMSDIIARALDALESVEK